MTSLELGAWGLLILSGVAVLGFLGALNLAIRHRAVRTRKRFSRCDRVVRAPQAVLWGRPVADWALAFYAGVLLSALLGLYQDARWLWILDGAVIVGVGATCYYAFILLFRLRTVCIGCLKLYFLNLVMAALLIDYHWNVLTLFFS